MSKYKHLTSLILTALLLSGLAWAQGHSTDQAEAPANDPVNMTMRFRRHLSGTETCLICHGSYNIITTRGAHQNESLWVNPDDFLGSMHARVGCVACHSNIDEFGHRLSVSSDRDVLLAQVDGENGHAEIGASGLSALEEKAFGQVDREAALVACANCHVEEFDQYKTSVHGQAVIGEGNADPPYCIDCHGWHYIGSSDDPTAMTNPANIPGTCKNCHGETEIMARYDIKKNVTETFGESFHARRGEMGAGEIAVCTSCHGWHAIYPADDPRSKINVNQIAQTCGECHQGAQINFASAFTHGEVSRHELVGIYAVTQTHKWMIVGIIAPLLFLVLVHLVKTRRAMSAQRRGAQS